MGPELLGLLTNPNVAYLLFALGLLGLAAEAAQPGMVVPGVIGAISMILALVAFGNLPVNWAGVLLLALAAVLLVFELHVAGVGFLAVGAMVAFVLGSAILYEPLGDAPPARPELHVSPWLILSLGVGLAGVFLLAVRAVIRVRRAAVLTGIEAMIGRTGLAVTDLAPSGLVSLEDETWSARALEQDIHKGESIRVIDVQGVTLWVRREA